MSDRPDAEAQIASLMFAALLVDPAGRVVEANHSAENLLGMSAAKLAGRSLSEVFAMNDERVSEKLTSTDTALVARDVWMVANGAETRVNLTVSPLGNHPGWRVLTLSEISREDTARENASPPTIGAPAILAHEIKNPLAAIRGAGQLIARKLPDSDRKLARTITDEVDRIARLIDRMQQLGSTRPEPMEPCNPHEAIRAAIATVRAGDEAQIEIREEFDPSLPPVMVNRDALEQVLINLISNARDAAAGSQEKPLITVRTRFVSGLAFSAVRLGQAVRLPIEITVTDNGPGIGEEMREHVFEPFVTTKKSGQGLGLALVRKLVRDMNGNVSHERDVKAGLTHFRVHLPRSQDSEASTA